MADNTLFINIAVILWATKLECKKDATGHFVPLNLDGWVNVGLVALVGFIKYSYIKTNVGISADVRSIRIRDYSALP